MSISPHLFKFIIQVFKVGLGCIFYSQNQTADHFSLHDQMEKDYPTRLTVYLGPALNSYLNHGFVWKAGACQKRWFILKHVCEQVYQGLMERDTALVMNVTGQQGDQLDILVENMGRVNFGRYINDNKAS